MAVVGETSLVALCEGELAECSWAALLSTCPRGGLPLTRSMRSHSSSSGMAMSGNASSWLCSRRSVTKLVMVPIVGGRSWSWLYDASSNWNKGEGKKTRNERTMSQRCHPSNVATPECDAPASLAGCQGWLVVSEARCVARIALVGNANRPGHAEVQVKQETHVRQ